MYGVIKYRHVENKTYMEFLNTTKEIETAINIAYTHAIKAYKKVINYHQKKEKFIFPCLIIFAGLNNEEGEYIYAVLEIPEFEIKEDTEYKYSSKELFGESDSEESDEDSDSDTESDVDSESDYEPEEIEEELTDLEELFRDSESDEMEDIEYTCRCC